jgi:integration host factor subunit beta
MTKRELIEKLAERTKNLSQKDAELVINTIFEAMTEALASGDRIEIRGFGSFQVKQRRSREGRNPRTGEKVMVKGKKIPFFKVGKELKERVDH